MPPSDPKFGVIGYQEGYACLSATSTLGHDVASASVARSPLDLPPPAC